MDRSNTNNSGTYPSYQPSKVSSALKDRINKTKWIEKDLKSEKTQNSECFDKHK